MKETWHYSFGVGGAKTITPRRKARTPAAQHNLARRGQNASSRILEQTKLRFDSPFQMRISSTVFPTRRSLSRDS